MPQFPLSGEISLPATLNQTNFVLIVADADYWILEADLAPQNTGNTSGFIAKLTGSGDIPNVGALSLGLNNPNAFTTTNQTVPTKYVEVYVGDWSKSPPLVPLDSAINADWKPLLAAIPFEHPPTIVRGEILVIAAKNLTSNAQKVNWHVNGNRMSARSKRALQDDPKTDE